MKRIILLGIVLISSCQLYGNNLLDKIWITTKTNSVKIIINGLPALDSRVDVKISSIKDEHILVNSSLDFTNDERKYKAEILGIEAKLWFPHQPELYLIELFHIRKNDTINYAAKRIGFREFDSKNGQLFLNGKPIFLRGIAINPPGRGIPSEMEKSREFALDYIRFMKSINVNIIRIPDNENWYEVCDELGMMVFGGNYSNTVDGQRPPTNYDEGVEWYKSIKFQPIMHHPSLMIYALTNEVPYKGDIAQKWIDFLSYAHQELKKWDNTRLYIGNAGYGYGQSGDICDLHRYWGWYYSTPYTFLNIRDYERITSPEKVQPLTFTECVGNYTGPDGRFNLTPNHKNPVSQLNWTGHAPQMEQQLLADEHQSWTFKQVTELVRRLRRINPESSGIFPFTIMFRNWHTARNLIDMNPKPVTRQARISYQPVLLSWENWQSQVYAGSTIQPIGHIINDSEDFSDLSNNQLVVRILDKAYSVLFSDTIEIPDIRYYEIHSEKIKLQIPAYLFSGYYKLEGIVYSEGKEVSRNTADLFISGSKNKGLSINEISVYDPSGKTVAALQRLGFLAKADANNLPKKLKILVVGENAMDKLLASKSNEIKKLVANGTRILVLRQNEDQQEFLNSILLTKLNFPTMNIDDPTYPPPVRPSGNGLNINPERSDHPVFRGIARKELIVWSDYTDWDETQDGFPAIYPVTNGFTLQNKPDKKDVAILANYSVGLEGIALAEFFESKGSVLLSAFDLVNRVGSDPVADRLLINLLDYTSKDVGHELYPLIEAPIVWGEYETEKGILDGITSGFMINAKPSLFGSYEELIYSVDKYGHGYAGAKWGWNNRAGKQYVPYGRRMFGPYYHRDFGGIPTPVDLESKTGLAYFWCRVPEGTTHMNTMVWNPSDEDLNITIGLNGQQVSDETILPGEYKWVESKNPGGSTTLKIELEGDRRLVVLETAFFNN